MKLPPENCELAHCCECCEFAECPANWNFEIEEDVPKFEYNTAK